MDMATMDWILGLCYCSQFGDGFHVFNAQNCQLLYSLAPHITTKIRIKCM